MTPFEKITHPGRGEYGEVFCRIRWDGTRLSITGVEGPKQNGDATGSCGQITVTLASYAPQWNVDQVAQFVETWRRWHLNDMRAGCEHQRAELWETEELEVVSYKLTTEAYYLREKATARAAKAAANGEACPLTDTERALVLLSDCWFKPRYSPPDADSPLSGCYEVEKRETKRAGWVTEQEHPRGVLSKRCPMCGYRYGSAWLTEAVPQSVLEFLAGLPDTDMTPAWV